jgi:hypothetical protein
LETTETGGIHSVGRDGLPPRPVAVRDGELVTEKCLRQRGSRLAWRDGDAVLLIPAFHGVNREKGSRPATSWRRSP